MAAAYVSGIAALYLGVLPEAAPADVHNAIVEGTVVDKIGELLEDTPNRLANIQFLGELDLCTDTGSSDGGVFDDPPTVCLGEALDLTFVIDTTGSMWDDIDAVKASAAEIVETIFTKTSNARVAIIDYRDFPVAPYGGEGDYPYHLVSDFSSDPAEIISAINSLSLGWGNNWDESVFSGLMAAIQGKMTISATGSEPGGQMPRNGFCSWVTPRRTIPSHSPVIRCSPSLTRQASWGWEIIPRRSRQRV